MALDDVRRRFTGLLDSIGRDNLHALFPNDFEFYAMSLELVDGQGNIKDSLFFPVLPESLSEGTQTIVSVTKSSSAVVSLFNPTFVPFNITMNGTFGRKFRILFGNTEVIASAINLRENVKRQGLQAANIFNTKIKTGYGVTKVLQRMLEGAFDVDDQGRSNKLFLYNLAFNSNYLVEVVSYSFTQSDKSNNQYWDYSIQFKAIAPALAVRGQKASSIIALMAFSKINQFFNDFTDEHRASYLNRQKRFLTPKRS